MYAGGGRGSGEESELKRVRGRSEVESIVEVNGVSEGISST